MHYRIRVCVVDPLIVTTWNAESRRSVSVYRGDYDPLKVH